MLRELIILIIILAILALVLRLIDWMGIEGVLNTALKWIIYIVGAVVILRYVLQLAGISSPI